MAIKKKPSFHEGMKKKELAPGKQADLEKGDFLAMILAAASIILPIVIIVFILIALFIMGWNSFAG